MTTCEIAIIDRSSFSLPANLRAVFLANALTIVLAFDNWDACSSKCFRAFSILEHYCLVISQTKSIGYKGTLIRFGSGFS